MLLDHQKVEGVPWVYCRLRQKTPFCANLSRVFALGQVAGSGPLLVGSPTLSFEAEEPSMSKRRSFFPEV
jgi:hypothetical protein